MNVPVSGKVIYPEDKQALADLILSDADPTYGKYNDLFESEFAKKVGVNKAYLVNSGSSGCLLAVAALTSHNVPEQHRLKRGDEVITVAASFPTTIAPLMQYGLIPVFVDVDETFNIRVDQLEKAYSNKTKAVFVAHTLGNPFNVYELQWFCAEHHIFLLEDASDSLDSKYGKRPCGSFGDISTFSAYPAHHITMGQGGVVGVNTPGLAPIVRSLRGWGKSCFVAGTKVDTSEGLKNIEQIQPGDYVFTHTGVYKPVTDIFSNLHSGEMYTITGQKRTPIVCTPNHKFLIKRCLVPKYSKYKSEYEETPRWEEAQNLKEGDLILEKVPLNLPSNKEITWSYDIYNTSKTEILPITNDLLRLCGYWLAEGSVSKASKYSNGRRERERHLIRKRTYYKYGVQFAFNKMETEYVDDVKALMKKMFGITGVYEHVRKNSNGISLNFNTRKGYEFFTQLFSKISYNKRLPDYFINLDKDALIGLLQGFWCGDGSKWDGDILTDYKKKRRACYSFCTTSPILFEQIRKILLRFEINPTIYVRTPDKHVSSVVNGKEIKAKHNLYHAVLYGQNVTNLTKMFGLPVPNVTPHKREYFTNDKQYAIFKISEIKHTPVINTPVYNFSVVEDNSYHVHGVVVHNCACSPGQDNLCKHRFDQQYGDLPFGYDHKYVFEEIGYNLQATQLQAFMGYKQLQHLDEFTEKRHENFNYLYTRLEEFSKGRFELPKKYPLSDPSWFGFTILLNPDKYDRRKVTEELTSRGVQNRLLFAGNITKQPLFQKSKYPYRVVGDLTMTDNIMNNLFWVGSYHGLSSEQMKYSADTIMEVLA